MVIQITQEDKKLIRCILDVFKSPKSDEQIFYNMCFCMCTPQTTFKTNKMIIKQLMDLKFYDNYIDKNSLIRIIRGIRYPIRKGERLILAKDNFKNILEIVKSDKDWIEKRQWLVDNILGFGMKTSSHFLRNLGAECLAIIDTHIDRFLIENGCKSIKYVDKEQDFIKIAESYQLTVAELDSFIWKTYSGTPWENFDF